jgi:hypothetical protein
LASAWIDLLRIKAQEMAEVAALNFASAELVNSQVVVHPGIRSSSHILRPLGWACLVWAFLSLKREQINNLHLQRPGEIFQPGHGRGINATLDQAHEFRRGADSLRRLLLRYVSGAFCIDAWLWQSWWRCRVSAPELGRNPATARTLSGIIVQFLMAHK